MSNDDILLMLQEKDNLIEEYPVLATPEVHPSVSLYIVVDNLDAVYEDIREKHRSTPNFTPLFTEQGNLL